MKHMAIAVVAASLVAAPLVAALAASAPSKTDDGNTAGAVLAAEIEDSRLECSREISMGELHEAVAAVLKENGFLNSDAPAWRAGMAAALRQHAYYVSLTKVRKAEICANLVENGFIK